MFIALRPVNVAGKSYRTGDPVPAEDVQNPLRLTGAGVLCQVPDLPAEPDLPAKPDLPAEPDPPADEPQAESSPKAAKKGKAQKEAAHV